MWRRAKKPLGRNTFDIVRLGQYFFPHFKILLTVAKISIHCLSEIEQEPKRKVEINQFELLFF